jgi:hypothetical protein
VLSILLTIHETRRVQLVLNRAVHQVSTAPLRANTASSLLKVNTVSLLQDNTASSHLKVSMANSHLKANTELHHRRVRDLEVTPRKVRDNMVSRVLILRVAKEDMERLNSPLGTKMSFRGEPWERGLAYEVNIVTSNEWEKSAVVCIR